MVLADRSASLARLGAYFRPRDARAAGVSFYELQRSVESGEVERVERGLYRRTAAELDETETMAAVASVAPDAIVCLLTALRVHDVGTQNPSDVWIALDRRRRMPARFPARVRVYRYSGPMLACGIETRRMLGVPVRVTDVARTVVDCFRYRNKIGTDVAMEALRDALRTRKTTADQILRVAEACRARTVVRPYLEAIP